MEENEIIEFQIRILSPLPHRGLGGTSGQRSHAEARKVRGEQLLGENLGKEISYVVGGWNAAKIDKAEFLLVAAEMEVLSEGVGSTSEANVAAITEASAVVFENRGWIKLKI